MRFELSDEEIQVLSKIANDTKVSPQAVLTQAIRVYQQIHEGKLWISHAPKYPEVTDF